MKKFFISISFSAITFVILFMRDYRYLQSKQPIFRDGKIVGPQDFTSFPPLSAWVFALPYAIAVFIVVFIIVKIFLKK